VVKRGLTDLERRTIRTALVAELCRAEEQAASLGRQFDDIVAAAEMSNTDDEHDPKGTTIANNSATGRPTLACSPAPPTVTSMSPTSSSGLGSAPASWPSPRATGLRNVGRHAFRHLAVTRWLRAGVPLRTAARWGGWSDVATMLRWYESRLPGDDELVAGRLAASVGEHNSR
jgi:hypothetical protein